MLVGGLRFDTSPLSGLWEFSPRWWGNENMSKPTGKWIQRQSLTTKLGGPIPQARPYHSMACFKDADLFLFGGQTGATVKNDLWFFNDALSTWTEVMTATSGSEPTSESPSARYQHAMAQLEHTALVFGGLSQQGTSLDDLWELIVAGYETNLIARWRRVPASGPSYRHAADMVPLQGAVFLFGGVGRELTDVTRLSSLFLSDFWHFSGCICGSGYQRTPFESASGGGHSCAGCPRDTYKDVTGLMPCFACPPNSFSLANAHLTSVTCSGGCQCNPSVGQLPASLLSLMGLKTT